MKARVRKIKIGTNIRYDVEGDGGKIFSSHITFTSYMGDTIGQVYCFQNHRYGKALSDGWFWNSDAEFYYHKSWLDEIPEILVMDDTGSDESDY